jgi:DNA ligase (NAD+)
MNKPRYDKNTNMEALVNKLNDWTKLYDEGRPEVSDEYWDLCYFELVEMEKELGYALPNSPTQKINYTVVNELVKVEHNHPMLSLAKTKSVEEVSSFAGSNEIVAMGKMDGLTCSLYYKKGVFVRAETRGNGAVGEDVTHNARVIKSIPKILKSEPDIEMPDEIVVDGEIICTKEDFKSFADEYKNPRNFAAGSIRLLDSKECETRNLTFIAWDLIKGGEKCLRLDNKLTQLNKWGFRVVPHFVNGINIENVSNDKETLSNMIAIIQKMCIDAGYPIDGIVFKYNICRHYDALGATDHHFRGGIAFKFYDEEYETEMLDIEWTMGRTGILTPVAVFKPIEIDGTIVERASLHNVSVMYKTLNGGSWVGQKIKVFKANMIIPQISWAEHEFDLTKVKLIPIPNTCPVCGGEADVYESNDVKVLRCTNSACSGKLINQLDHFCSKKGLDIKGLSKATLEKLVDWGWVENIYDIFNLDKHKTEWMSKPGFGEKSVSKILAAIPTSCELSDFIAALGIPLVGKSVAKELVKYIEDYDDFRRKVEGNYDFSDIDGFGPATNEAIKHFNYNYADSIYSEILNIKNTIVTTNNNSLEGLTFVITGKLKTYKNRDEIVSVITSFGGKVGSSVTNKTNYLINNDVNSNSSKNIAAQRLGIPILTEEEFKNLLDK